MRVAAALGSPAKRNAKLPWLSLVTTYWRPPTVSVTSWPGAGVPFGLLTVPLSSAWLVSAAPFNARKVRYSVS
jgi:hypothetical protein